MGQIETRQAGTGNYQLLHGVVREIGARAQGQNTKILLRRQCLTDKPTGCPLEQEGASEQIFCFSGTWFGLGDGRSVRRLVGRGEEISGGVVCLTRFFRGSRSVTLSYKRVSTLGSRPDAFFQL